MFQVFYEGCLFGAVKSIEEAVSLALAVHRSSNVPHNVDVYDVKDMDHIIVKFHAE